MEMELSRNQGAGAVPDGARLSRGLGWFSIGVGLAEVAAPRAVARAIGLEANGRIPGTLRILGAREIVEGLGILARPRRSWPLWLRVAGDAIDLSLLAYAMRSRCTDRQRLTAAIASVLGVTVLDVFATRRVQRSHRAAMRPVIRAITIMRPVSDVYGFWRNLEQLPRFMAHLEAVRPIDGVRSHWVARTPVGLKIEWDAEIVEDRRNERIAWRSIKGSKLPSSGSVSFTPTLDGLGTEVRVEMQMLAPGTSVGAALGKLFAGPQIEGDLRRLKQVLETGEVVHSDASIHRRPHPAQPSERGAQP